MTINAQTLSELKSQLLAEKVRLREELGRIAKPTSDPANYDATFNQIGTDEDENAAEIEEYTDNLALESTFEKQLKEIVEALGKIEAGTYGKCENCQIDIPIERLRAYPAAKTCLSC